MKKIGVVGAGLVGSIFKNKVDYEVIPSKEWQSLRSDWKILKKWRGLVNCCAIAGQKPCDDAGFDAVNRANVRLAREMAYCAINAQIPFITFSTSAVYAPPHGNYALDEAAPLDACNLYAASKIVMEAVMPPQAFIFRIPMVITGSGAPNDFPQKVKGWKVVENVDISIIHAHTIAKAVNRVMNTKEVNPGIYNLASEVVHLPTFIKAEYDWEGEVVEAYSLGLSPPVVFNTQRAERKRLI